MVMPLKICHAINKEKTMAGFCCQSVSSYSSGRER